MVGTNEENPQAIQQNQSLQSKNWLKSLWQRHRNITLIILGAAVIILIILLILFLKKQNNSLTQKKSTIPNLNSGSTSNLPQKTIDDISKNTTAFIEGLYRPEDGFYNYVYKYDEQCEDKNGIKECPFNGVKMFQTTNAWTALAYFGQYKITGNKKYLDLAQRDLDKLYEWCDADPSQCLWVLAQPALIYQQTKDPKTLAFLNSEGVLLSKTPVNSNLMLASIETRELLLIGQAVNNQAFINEGIRRLPIIDSMLTKQPNIYLKQNQMLAHYSCWVALANATGATTGGKNQQYANTLAFLNNAQLIKNFDQILQPIDVQPCIEAYTILGDKKMASDIFDKFISTFYKNEGGYLFYKSGVKTTFPNLMILTDAGYSLYLAGDLNK